MNQIKRAWAIICAFFRTESESADAYLSQSILDQWQEAAKYEAKNVTILTPAVRRRYRNKRDMQRNKGTKK